MGRKLRKQNRGNAGLAVVAVALLILGGAAAVVLRSFDDGRWQDTGRADATALVREAQAEGDALSALAQAALESTFLNWFVATPGALRAFSETFRASLELALENHYPRLASSGRTVGATLEFAKVEGADGEASMPSPFGGRFVQTVPLYLEGVGAANVTVSEGKAHALATVPFVAQHLVPLLLPLSLAAHVSLEASGEGRVERLTSQAAQRALESPLGRALGTADGAALVRFALESELALDFGSSGNATLDAVLKALQVSTGSFRASSFFGGWADGPEPFSLEGRSDAFRVDGQVVRLKVLGLDTSNISVEAHWIFFDGQELSDTPWGGLSLGVSGSFSVEVEVDAPRGRAAVGPFEIPVNFVARAYTPWANSESVVGAPALDSAVLDLATSGRASRFAAPLMAAGYLPNQTGYFAINESSRAVVLAVLVQEAGAGLPPLENITEFQKAFAPPEVRLAGATLLLDAPEDLNGSRALLTVDGAAASSAVVEGGRLVLHALPEGRRALRVSLEVNGTEYLGQVEAAVAGPSASISLALAPTLSSAFLHDALARGEAVPERAGFAVLDEAGDIVGLQRPTDQGTALEAAAFAEAVLLRLEALDWAHAGSRAQQARARDAQLFLKVTTLTLKAADASYRERKDASMPIGALASSAVELAFKPDVKGAVAVTVASVTLAKVAVDKGLVEVSFFSPAGSVGKLHFGFEHLLLVSTALGGAMTLATDAVKITQAVDASRPGDPTSFKLLIASTATDFASLCVGIARGVYTLAGKEALAAVKSTLGRLTVAVGAAALIIDLAFLYHKHGGDLGALWDELVHPASVGDLLHLPNLVGGAVAVTVDILGMVMTTGVTGGPVGLAASLFVLAALLVANKEQVASALWGTIPYSALPGIRSNVAETLNASFSAAASANSVDRARLHEAARTSASAASSAWLDAALARDRAGARAALDRGEAWRVRAAAASRLAQASAAMHFAAAALAEQLDDLASPAHQNDEGRRSEGYGYHFEPGKEIHYRGDVRVFRMFEGGMKSPLTRAEWRALLETVEPAGLATYTFAYNLTETNGIPLSEYEKWGDKVAASGAMLEAAFEELLGAETAIREVPV